MRVLVTGATSGFGKLIVGELLAGGQIVVASGRRLTQRTEILADLRVRYPDRLHEIDLDVTVEAERLNARRFCQEKIGGLDILINNAGYGLFGAFEDTSEQDLRQQMEINFIGLSLMIRDFLPLLRSSQGRILNFSSVFGFVSFPLTSVYCASKYAIEGLTESLYHELKPHGVQVCLIEPGSFQTGFGSNTTWATDIQKDGTYARQTKNYMHFRDRLNRGRPLNNPSDLARGVARVCRKKRLPLRMRFGLDAQATYFARRFLPAQIFLDILTVFFSRNVNKL